MKFLCVKCDDPMKLVATAPPDRGSLSVVYRCPTCAHEIAMLTNPYETQLVQSLGVKIGGATAGSRAERARRRRLPAAATDPSAPDLSKCPFSEMVQEMTAPGDTAISWTDGAEERLKNIPRVRAPDGPDRHREVRPATGP